MKNEDILSIMERDPAAKNVRMVKLYPGYKALKSYRIAHWFYERGFTYIASLISQRARRKTGIEIHPAAKIGKGLFIDHGMGVVIGETAEIGDYCTIYQGVTLGGTGKDVGKRHPTLLNNVLVGAGAKILGPITIGSNSKVASNAVVLDNVPDNCTAVGVPARIVKQNGKKVNQLDHVHIPDPVAAEICKLQMQIDKIKNQLKKEDENENI